MWGVHALRKPPLILPTRRAQSTAQDADFGSYTPVARRRRQLWQMES